MPNTAEQCHHVLLELHPRTAAVSQPTAGEFYELTAIAAVVLGGASLQGGEGTLYKSVIGVFIMIVLGNALNLLNVDSYWQRVAVGAVIIAAAAAERLRSRQ